jgi:AcrR family transcriptional regulator
MKRDVKPPVQSLATRRPSKEAPTRPRYRRSNPGVPRRTLKRSQHQRLIDAMIELSAQRGYNAVSITDLCSEAGVSPVTFYEHFPGKEDCFLASYLVCGEQIFGQMRVLAADDVNVWQASRAALDELLRGLEGDPDAGRLLFIEALGAGPAIHEARNRVLEELARGVQAVLARTRGDAMGVDVPMMAVIGALRHIISRYLRTHAEDQLPALLEDGLRWLSRYAVPSGTKPWSTSLSALLDGVSEPPTTAAWAPETLPPGTHGLPASVIARSQRTRLVNATAEVMMAKGYKEAKISDIVAAARVARPVFYAHFQGKEHAFLEAQEHPTQYILDSCAEAYFSADQWPERIWRMLARLLDLVAANRAISHLRLVECYAAGPAAIRRAEEITRSFTIFLQEGYRYRPEAASLPRLCSHAIAGAIFEIVQRLAAAGEWAEIQRHLPQLAYIAIAPFTGAEHAIGIVEALKARGAPALAIAGVLSRSSGQLPAT